MKKCMWIIAVLWFVVENQFFGWNALPQSANELLADGIGYILVSLAVMSGRLGIVVSTAHHNARKSITIK